MELAPPHVAYQKIMADQFDYLTADLDSPLAMCKTDLTAMQFADNTFDVITCFHVLEHIPDDMKAMQELRRCLKSDGVALINVPFRTDISQTVEFNEPDPLLSMHVRDYGTDVIVRLVKAGFDVEVVECLKYIPPTLAEQANMGGGLLLFVCRK